MGRQCIGGMSMDGRGKYECRCTTADTVTAVRTKESLKKQKDIFLLGVVLFKYVY